MSMKSIISIILITLGIVVLAYSGLSFNTPGKPIDFLGLHFETTVSHYISPAFGAIALVSGIVLLLVRVRPRSS